MRLYQVPFSAKEEERFVGLTLREAAWTLGGLLGGVLLAGFLNFLMGRLVGVLFLLAVPFGLAGFIISRWPVRETDSTTTMDRHIIKGLRYRFKTHSYLYRR